MPKLILTLGDIPVNEFKIDKVQVSLGRQADSDIVLNDPVVSAKHALLLTLVGPHGGKDYLLQDLNSTNGTRLNGKDINKKAPLKNGDIIQIGRSALRFVADDTL